jgi:hypothetical protein
MLLDGELSGEESADLEAYLLADESARVIYANLVQLHNALESRFASGDLVQRMAAVPMERIISIQQRRIVRNSLVAAAAVLVVSAVTMWFILVPRAPVEVGTLRTSVGARLAVVHPADGEAGEAGSLVEGAVLHLREGTLEGRFHSGVRLIAEAPCRLRVLREDMVGLERGKAWFRVPSASAGFRVRAKRLTAVDLGTEFGVISAADGRDEVHVLKGKVEVTPSGDRANGRVLAAGSAVALDADGRLRAIDSDASLFARDLSTTRAVAIANFSFEADVLPRDGDPATKDTGNDDYDKDIVPSGWRGFDDGGGGTGGVRGLLSTAPDGYFHRSLAATPDDDANDQVFYSAARDIYQVLEEPVRPDGTYVLRVDIGDRRAAGDEGAPGNPGIRLGVGDTPGEGLLEPSSTDFPPQVDGGWVTWTATYVTGPEGETGEGPLRIELTSGSRVGWFDRVRLSVTR